MNNPFSGGKLVHGQTLNRGLDVGFCVIFPDLVDFESANPRSKFRSLWFGPFGPRFPSNIGAFDPLVLLVPVRKQHWEDGDCWLARVIIMGTMKFFTGKECSNNSFSLMKIKTLPMSLSFLLMEGDAMAPFHTP